MQNFLRLLRAHEDSHSLPQKLVTFAGKLCRDLQHNFAQVMSLVKAILESRHRRHLLDSADVALVCVRVLVQQEQHLAAIQILEGCRVPGRTQELVQLWNDIHYHLTMRKLGVTMLSPVQKFRCRKRNPAPTNLCPEGPKNRNFLPGIRRHLHNFATSVGVYPKKAQLLHLLLSSRLLSIFTKEKLALETSLTPEQVYNWFANYRRRQKAHPLRIQRAREATSGVSSAKKSGPGPLQLPGNHHKSAAMSQWSAGSGTPQCPENSQASQEPHSSLAGSFSGDSTASLSLAFRSLHGWARYQEGPGYHPVSLTSICPTPGLHSLAVSSNTPVSSVATPESWRMPYALSSSKEVFLHTGQPNHRNQLNSGMDPDDATMPVAIAAVHDPSHAGFTDLYTSCFQRLYSEEGPRPSGGQAASTADVKIHHSHRSLEVMPASSAMPAPVSTMELRQPSLSSQAREMKLDPLTSAVQEGCPDQGRMFHC